MPQNYYVASNLSDIGRNMSQDYSAETQRAIAEIQARNEYAKIIQQAIQAQAARQQQGSQFDQEMAYRNAALQQQGQLKGQELGQGRTQFDQNLAYMREALKAQLQNSLDLGRMQYSSERNDPRVAAALIDQQGRTARDQAELDAGAEMFNNNATARAAQYNALLDNIKQQALVEGKAKNKWIPFKDDVNKDKQSEVTRTGINTLLAQLSADKQAEGVSFDQVQGKFVAIPRTRRQISNPQAGPGNIWQFLLQAIKGGQPQAQAGPNQNDLMGFAKDAIARGANPAQIQAEMARMLGQSAPAPTTPYPEKDYRALLGGIQGGASASVWPPVNQGQPLPPPQDPRVLPINGLQADPNQLNMQSLIQALNAFQGQ